MFIADVLAPVVATEKHAFFAVPPTSSSSPTWMLFSGNPSG